MATTRRLKLEWSPIKTLKSIGFLLGSLYTSFGRKSFPSGEKGNQNNALDAPFDEHMSNDDPLCDDFSDLSNQELSPTSQDKNDPMNIERISIKVESVEEFLMHFSKVGRY